MGPSALILAIARAIAAAAKLKCRQPSDTVASSSTIRESHNLYYWQKVPREGRGTHEKIVVENMGRLCITEEELARDIHGVLLKVREGIEVIIEKDHRPIAVIKTPPRTGREICECLALAKAYEARFGSAPFPDPDFAKDVQAAVEAHSQPLNPPSSA